MQNISGFGLTAQIVASNTFPNGFTLTEFADDADPLDSPDMEVADTAFGLNGDMVLWTRPVGIEITLNVIPTSEGDENLSMLLNANRIGKGKQSSRDIVGIVLNYPNGMIVNMSPGVMITGSIVAQVASAGRIKTRSYRFRFQNITKTGGN
jgi:hypothetical protein